ncbi:MAG TPA: hypothetical protein VJ302_19765 [Blastocatellia bacterium]|nr:hypothetical protein [Blastocatellia bacterium]
MIGAALMLLAFMIGFVPLSLRNQQLKNELQQKERERQQASTEEASNLQNDLAVSQEKLQLTGLNTQLGMLMIKAQKKNFGEARTDSTKFFDGLRQFAQQTRNHDLRDKLLVILNRRDEITADLTMASPGTADKLRALYGEMYRLAA